MANRSPTDDENPTTENENSPKEDKVSLPEEIIALDEVSKSNLVNLSKLFAEKPDNELKDIYIKRIFTYFPLGIIYFLIDLGLEVFKGYTFISQLSSELFGPIGFKIRDTYLSETPTFFKKLADYIFEANPNDPNKKKREFFYIEFQSSHSNDQYYKFAEKALSLSTTYKYDCIIHTIVIYLPPRKWIQPVNLSSLNLSFNYHTAFISNLNGKEILAGLLKKVENNELLSDCDVINLCLLPTMRTYFKNYADFNNLIEGWVQIYESIPDKDTKFFCSTIFLGFIKIYFQGEIQRYIKEGKIMNFSNIMDPIVKMTAEDVYKRFSSKAEADKQRAVATAVATALDRAEVEKLKALADIAKKLIVRGLASDEEIAEITSLDLETVQNLKNKAQKTQSKRPQKTKAKRPKKSSAPTTQPVNP
ncbi:MAG: hypothetical protein LBT38_12015 [Deltaproteobacteria bacterium]|jgi:hypothetical protein|nr:hypothetical protein [Deltaproteobacteria bacterium]